MILDMRTMYAVVAVTCLILGSVQLLALAGGVFGRWVAWWGLSNLLVGLGTLAISLRSFIPDIVSIDIGNLAMLSGFAFLLAGVRTLAGRRIGWTLWGVLALAVVGPMPLWRDPDSYGLRIAYLSALTALLDAAVIREGLRLARQERLASAWILVGLFATTMSLFAIRTVAAATGHVSARSIFLTERAGTQEWLAVTAAAFVALRGIALMMMVTERDRNLLLAMAQQDPLTGVSNRAGLEEAVAQLTRRKQATAALLLIDIDRFKALNDTFGHAAGDQVLRRFVLAAQTRLRPTDILARHGGDEFVVVLPGSEAADAVSAAQRIRDAFATTASDHDGLRGCPTLSIGIAVGDLAQEGLQAMLQRADDALYRSKRHGRNRVEILTAVNVAV